MQIVDFLLRLLFFLTVPYLATLVASKIPMTGVIINIAVTLIVFAFAEVARERAEKSRLLHKALARRFAFEAYYRENPPRPFLFYVFYPLLLPYVVARPLTRKELGLYRGFTGGGIAILVAAAAFDFYRHWQPELDVGHFIGVWIALFLLQTLAIFVFLLPISTTVVKLHSERRLVELWVLLGAAAISVAAAVGTLVAKRGHIVSLITTYRVDLRTKAVPAAAKTAQHRALRAVWDNVAELRESTDADGYVEGDALDRAEEALGEFYKADEAYAFSLHALPATAPDVLVIQCHLGKGKTPVWLAMKRTGEEVTSPSDLPHGVLGLERRKTRRPPTKQRTPAKAPARAPASAQAPPLVPSPKRAK